MKNIIKKLAILIIGMCIVVFFSGFCASHDWIPATCENPETCSDCGASKGESLGHQWGELYCDAFSIPDIDGLRTRTCERCGAVLHPISSGRWTYRILDDGTVEIVSVGRSNVEEIIIPTYIDGLKVSTIGEKMLFMDYNAMNVVIPEGITTIGEDAFADCDGAYRINIPASVTTIVGNPFRDRWGKNITVSPDNPKFEVVDSVLFDKDEKRMIYRPIIGGELSYAVPEGTLEIGTRAFLGGIDNTLKEIILPNSLRKIDDYAFEGCYELERIDIPEGVISIGYCLLPDCFSIETITIPSSVSEMNGNPFVGKKVEVVLSPDNPFFEIIDGVLFHKGSHSLVAVLDDARKESYVIPEGTTEICAGAFSGCGFRQITIPESVTVIGEDAFQYCTNLEVIVIPEGVTEIGKGAFSQCENLETVTLPDSLKKIGKGAFLGCSSLIEITVPQGVTEIDDGAFCYCSILSGVSLPVGLTKIGNRAFENTAIESIDIPQGTKFIGNGAFYFCRNLKYVLLPEGLTSIGRYAFSECGIEEITVPESVTTIGYEAFWGSG